MLLAVCHPRMNSFFFIYDPLFCVCLLPLQNLYYYDVIYIIIIIMSILARLFFSHDIIIIVRCGTSVESSGWFL